MNIKEAYAILEIPQTATPEEAKKKYRELTKKHHPDINKDPGSEAQFKKINEAYQIVSSGKGTDRESVAYNPFRHNPFTRQQQPDNIILKTTVSFKDSVRGCKVDLKFNRKTKCQECHGQGAVALNNGCDKCGGRGQITVKQGNMIFVQSCDKCYGRNPTVPCKSCNSQGSVEAETSINVAIPGGIISGNILRISGMGHFVGYFGPLEQNTDAHLHVSVIPEVGLTLDGNHVISTLELSLVEAIQGCKKTVKTIMGDKEIDIKPKSRNKEEVIIPRLGVNGTGNQRVILDVKYPEDINKLIDILTNERIS